MTRTEILENCPSWAPVTLLINILIRKKNLKVTVTHVVAMKNMIEIQVSCHTRTLHQVTEVSPGIRAVRNSFFVALKHTHTHT